MKNKYTLYKDTKRVGDFQSIESAASFIGCRRQNIQQNKRGLGCYIWKNYILMRANTWEAEALLNYKRLARYVNSPATAWTVYSELKKLLARLGSEEI